ncbi:penicillin-binding protein AmpH [Enterobacter cloacae]|uniref:Penicillin-binding protein AmpH n=1 Tax=Enterobacter cloacae TaxID=550 RepID=A0A377M890_ENTCL|nr:penicillin-binding protein AmpH [Enterobacter cloacae]
MAMIPQSNVGAFVVVTRSPNTRFVNMSDGINNLVAELSAIKPRCLPPPSSLNIPWANG